MLLVKFNRGWADEFSVYGMALMELEAYKSLIKWAKNATWNFGTNEGWEEEDISDGFTTEYVDDLEEDVLRRTVFTTSSTFGIFPDWREIQWETFYDRHDIVQDGGGWAVELDGNQVGFGFGSYDEADKWLEARLQKLLI